MPFKPKELKAFAARIANFTDESEIEGGMSSEDAISTMNSLIEEARKLTGIEPRHEKVWCVECQMDYSECECDCDD